MGMGRYQDGTTTSWLTEDVVRDSFSPLQLDVFHAMWEDYHGQDQTSRATDSRRTRSSHTDGGPTGVSTEHGGRQGTD